MAVTAGTVTKYDIKGKRESLSDMIYDISPEDTPFLSMAGRGEPADATLVEWQIDQLEDPDGSNAQLEGDEAAFDAPDPTKRVGNYAQISRKTVAVSGTTEAVKKAGRKSELARLVAKRSKGLKRDMETILLQNQGGESGASDVARKLAALPAWVKTNVDKASDGANPTYTNGVPSTGRTDGTQRAFTETMLKTVAQLLWNNGGEARTLMVGAYNKTKVSGFAGIVSRNFDISNASPKPTAVIASVDVYVSDFGTFRTLPNRFQRARDAWFIDPEMVSLRYLRDFQTTPLAKTGDSEKRMLLGEYTLQVNNEAGLGLVADLTTSG